MPRSDSSKASVETLILDGTELGNKKQCYLSSAFLGDWLLWLLFPMKFRISVK